MLLELMLTQALAATPAKGCPHGMARVAGAHYEQVQRLCTDKRLGKCWAFFPELMLLEPRVTRVDVCMDRYEWPNQKGAAPLVMASFTEAESACRAAGKRLCSELEWEVACEGPGRLPWPYGWAHQPGACNSDKPYRLFSEKKLSSSDPAVRGREARRLWQGEPAGSFPRCASPHGVYDLVGNVEEWVTSSRPEWPHRSSLKGGFWSKPWSGCRGTNERHGPSFRFYEIGFRCCADPR